MSLTAALFSARSALNASSLGIQIAGHNMANVATPGYSRQVAILKAVEGSTADRFRIGRGVMVTDVQRKVDEALLRRLRAGISGEHAAAQKASVFDQLETILNELTSSDLSTMLNDFFATWSEATSLLDSGAAVIEQGDQLAGAIQRMRLDFIDLRTQSELQIEGLVNRADELLEEVALLNTEIMNSEIGQARANALRDQRDQVLGELSTLMDISVIEDGQGAVDVLVGSTPVVISGTNRGLDTKQELNGEVLEITVIVADDSTPLPVSEGKIGGLLASRDGTIDQAMEELSQLAAQLIFEVNKIHATGTNADGLTDTISNLQVPIDDRDIAINSPDNHTLSTLPFAADNGSFVVRVKNTITGSTDTIRIDVDLDGLDSAGLPGYDDDTTAEDIRAALDAIDGVNAEWTPSGKLSITSETGFEFSFGDDSSGVLGVLGVNAYFTGTGASNIAIRQDLLDAPAGLTLGRIIDDTFVENGNAMQIAALQNTELTALGGRTTKDYWSDTVQTIAVKSSSAKTDAIANRVVRENLDAQRSATSGVSIDEESINLITYQQQYQAAARVIDIADQLIQMLLNIV